MLLGCRTRIFLVFSLFMYNKSMVLALDKTKNKVNIWRYFCIFTSVFRVITRVIGVFWYFKVIFLIFK